MSIVFGGTGLVSKTNGFERFARSGKKIIRLNPQKWKDQDFPLYPYIETSGKQNNTRDSQSECLTKGRWTILLYHHGCQECQIQLQRLTKDGISNLACIEVPPCHGMNYNSCFYGCLTDQEKWFVATPSIIITNNGKVVDIQSGF